MKLTQVFRLLGIVLALGSNPLIKKFVDNAVAGTPTKIDDWVWKILSWFAASGSVNSLEDVLAKLNGVQENFDTMPAEEKAAAKAVAPGHTMPWMDGVPGEA